MSIFALVKIGDDFDRWFAFESSEHFQQVQAGQWKALIPWFTPNEKASTTTSAWEIRQQQAKIDTQNRRKEQINQGQVKLLAATAEWVPASAKVVWFVSRK